MISARTRVFALLGDPVAHSLSPHFQNAGFRAAGLDAVYVALRTNATSVPGLMQQLAASGGGGNITIPHKGVAAGVGTPSPLVSLLGAANTFGGGEGLLLTENTDVAGVHRALTAIDVSGGAWLVIGTGGSARAVIGAARVVGAGVAIHSRDQERGAALTAWAASIGVPTVPAAACDVAINATPLGLHAGDALPLDLRDYPGIASVLDLVYHPDRPTLWVEMARGQGRRASDGRDVLLGQGLAAWALWFPGIEPPEEVMRAALHGHLG